MNKTKYHVLDKKGKIVATFDSKSEINFVREKYIKSHPGCTFVSQEYE